MPYSTHFARNIHKLLVSYKEVDPPTKRQASLPMFVFQELLEDKSSSLDEAIGELTNGALYFAMRSCEYSTTTEKNPRTKRLKIRNIAFYNSRGHKLKKRKNFAKAHCVKITFENQKNGEKMETITRTRGDPNSLCKPVEVWAKIVNRVLSYNGTGPNTYVNAVCIDGKLRNVTASIIGSKIKSVVDKIGVKRLGFTRDDVGTHSIRTSFATMLSFLKVDPTLIMLNGRWKSDAVLRYIRIDIISSASITLALQDKVHHHTIKLI